MMINLETPKKFKPLAGQAHQVATEVLRPISRKYDAAEHAYPKELDMLASMIDGHERVRLDAAAPAPPASAPRRERRRRSRQGPQRHQPLHRARHHRDVLGRRRPAALDAAPGPRQLRDRRRWPTEEQLERFDGMWAAMAITEPGPARTPRPSAPPPCSTATSTCSTARRSSSPRATAPTPSSSGRRSTRSRGRAAIKSFVVPKGTPGHEASSGSSTSSASAPRTPRPSRFENCRVPQENLLGTPEVDAKQGFAGAMQTFDNTRPLVAAMAVGCAARVARR